MASTPNAALMELLVCPVTHWTLRVAGDQLIAQDPEGGDGLSYPIRDGIPILLADQAGAPGGGDPAEWIRQWEFRQADSASAGAADASSQ